MDPVDQTPKAAPDASKVESLKRLAAGIIRVQGNRFIKELLRLKGIRIGITKDDFEDNLNQAIESGALVLDDVDKWLKSVEGWGNQHVYLYKISPLLMESLAEPVIRDRVGSAGLREVWGKPTVLAFPDELTLTSIMMDGDVLSMVWQKGSPGWTPVPEKNYVQEEDLDTYEYRAWRRVEQRTISRFECRLDKQLAAIFIAMPINGEDHEIALSTAKHAIGLIMDIEELEGGRLDISAVSRNIDQRNVPSNVVSSPKVKTQKSRLTSGGAYVEFAANSRDKAYWEETAIKNVRKAVKTPQLSAFQGTDGVFIFQAGAGSLGRPLRVQLYAPDRRIRLWAQMAADEVWEILAMLAAYQ